MTTDRQFHDLNFALLFEAQNNIVRVIRAYDDYEATKELSAIFILLGHYVSRYAKEHENGADEND